MGDAGGAEVAGGPALAARHRWLLLAVPVVLAAGAFLRLLWLEDMEYKYDEAWMFERARAVAAGEEPWPALGMPSGAGPRNPGMSVWVFAALVRFSGAVDPVALARAVALLNVLALVALGAFVLLAVKRSEREPWAWAWVLAAVNPMAVQLQRKIWAQSVLPLFCVVALAGWWHRGRRWGAFLWGASGALLGQIHMSGFFLSGGFVLWAAAFGRERVRWRWWLAGAALGAVPLIPWLAYLAEAPAGERLAGSWKELIRFRFWGHWTGEAVGFHVGRSLGLEAFWRFLAAPEVGGRATWAVGVLHLALFGAAALVLWTGGRELWRRRGEWRALFVGAGSETAFTQSAALWGFGLLMTGALVGAARHYLIVAYPLNLLWLARLALAEPRRGRRALAVVAAAQLAVAVAFLVWVHAHGGSPGGDYGVAFSRQTSPPEL